jgi:hypothetical protein
MTTTTAIKKAAASPAPTSPHRDLQEDSTTSDPNVKQAVDNDVTNMIDAREEVELETDNPVVTPDHDSESRLDPDDPNFDTLKVLTTEGEEEEKEEEEKKGEKKEEKEEKKGPLTATNEALLAQNKYLIRKLAELNRYTIDRMLLPPPPLTLCVACGSTDQNSGVASEKKKSKSSGPNVHLIIRRTLRIVSVLLLLFIAVQLGLIRGEGVAQGRSGRSGRRMGFFGR